MTAATILVVNVHIHRVPAIRFGKRKTSVLSKAEKTLILLDERSSHASDMS